MQYSIAYALAAVVIGANAQGAAPGLAPSGSAPAGCQSSTSGYYEVTITKPAPASKRSIEKRATACGTNALVVQLSNGVLTDAKGRIGSIVANRQFQFDGPPAQTGAIYDAGFSICSNTSIAIGPTTDFYQCLSGSFYNLYDQPSESNCTLVNLNAQPCTPSATSGSGSASSASSMGSSMVTSAPTVSQQSDGQPTATSAGTVSQISDGQPQASSAKAIPTGAAERFAPAGAIVAMGAAAAFFL